MEIKQVLESIGFEDIEAKVYLFLLKKGTVSQQIIADETGILRQTVYDTMKKMEMKGYVGRSLMKRHKVYHAIEPETILNQIKEKEEQFLEILPTLNEMKQINQVNLSSQTFIGLEGLKNLFSLTLKSQTEILWLCNKEISDRLFYGFYWHNYAKKRIEKKISIKLLIEPTPEQDWDTNKKALRETRRNKILESLSSSFVLFDDKILIYSMKEEQLQGILIQNQSIKESFESIFNLLWKIAKK